MKSSDPSMQTMGYLQPARYCEAKAGLSLSARTLFSHAPLNSVDTVTLCYLPFSQWFCDQREKWRTADFSYVKEGLENPVLVCARRGRERGRQEGLGSGPAPQRRSPGEKCFPHWGGELPLTFSSAPNLQQASSEKGGGVEQGGGWGRRPGKPLSDKGSRNRASLQSYYFTAPQAHMPRLANVMGQGPPRG